MNRTLYTSKMLTNYEVLRMFEGMVRSWFSGAKADYNDFIKAMLLDDIDAIILEFKVFNKRREQSLEDTVQSALLQIEEKQYTSLLIDKGIPKEHIRTYGFAFQGKNVLIGS